MDTLRYIDGTPIRVGDRVLIEHGRTGAIVETIIVTSAEVANYGTRKPGIMLLSEPFGRVFWPFDIDDDPLIFVERSALPET